MNTDQSIVSPVVLVEGERTDRILSAAFKMSNALGSGFLEKVYENSLAIELRERGSVVEAQKAYPVRYEGTIVGDYTADLVVDGKVIVECKAVTALDPIHDAQLLNYLKASGIHVGLLLNFGRPKLQYRRLVV
jgi:GxxExxY protein